jgi:hypothetical protein
MAMALSDRFQEILRRLLMLVEDFSTTDYPKISANFETSAAIAFSAHSHS